MPDFNRYAVYYAPEAGEFADFAARWLGWDAATGEPRAHPDIPDLPRPVEEITATPRKYGFHGTLKPPFRLAKGVDRDRLDHDLSALAASLAPVDMPGLALTPLGRFLALTPEGDDAALSALAAACVSRLDPLRAPLTESELARRRKGGLTERQEELLAQWGYPHVMEEFRFHLTLTGPLDRAEVPQVAEALRPHQEPLLPRPFRIADLCLFGEDEAGMFHLLHRYALTG